MKEIMNKTLVVKFETTAPVKTVFSDGGNHVELSGVDPESTHKEWHHVIINEEAWRMFSPHVHIGDAVKFTGKLVTAEPGEKKYYEHTMKNGHKYPIGYLRDTVPTGFIAAPKVGSDCPWANDERTPLVGWDDLPIRKADDGNTDKKVLVR